MLVTILISTASAYTPTYNGKYIVTDHGSKINLVNNAKAHNPTYNELITFLKKDKTDQKKYVNKVFSCGDFAQAVHNNAENAGIKAGVVRLDYKDISTKHLDNVFLTSDKGIVYTSCIDYDKIGKFQIGKKRVYTSLAGKSYTATGTIKTVTRYW